VAIDVASPFFAPLKLAFFLALILAVPYVLYQIWAFVAPGLYRHEQRLARPLLVSATLLFYVGCAFAYFVVLPLVFGFLTSVTPEGVTMMTDISRYLDFVLVLFLAFGISFAVGAGAKPIPGPHQGNDQSKNAQRSFHGSARM
jgi:sec-independent protein translocase protein TatC